MNLTRLCRPFDASRKGMRAMTLHTFLSRLIWLCVVPLLLLAVYLAGTYVHTLQTQKDREASGLAHNLATGLDQDLGARMAALQALAASPLMDDPPRLKEFYKEAHGFRDSFSGHVVLSDLSMQMIFNTRVPFGSALPKLPQPGGHAAAPAVLATGKPAVGDMFLGPIAKEPLIALVVPLIRNGQIRALLLSIIETRQFQQRLDELALPAGWSVTLLDSKNEVMARRSPKDMEDVPAAAESPGRFIAKLTVSHWSVVLEIPRSMYRAPIFSVTATLVVAILAVTIISVLGGRLASRRLARSMAMLAEKQSPEALHPVISEIETIRTILDDATAARDASEETLHKSEERFKAIASNTPDHILMQDSQLRYVFVVNPQLGLTEQDMIGKTDYDFLLKEEADKLTKVKRQVLENGEPLHFETSLISKDGKQEFFEGTYVPKFDAQGKIDGLIGYFRNITEQKKRRKGSHA